MKRAIFPGSFDPFTLGHLELVKYASSKYDIVYVVALNNAEKSYMFSSEERKHIISLSISDIENAVADAYEGFTADYMNEHGITHIVRGVRGQQDIEYEQTLAEKMKEFNPNFETELVICKPEFKDISSTEARRRINNDEPLKSVLHEKVIDFIDEK